MNKPKIIQLPKITDVRGNLSFFETSNHIPFEIQRSYWIYDVPGGEMRGGHAYKKNCELLLHYPEALILFSIMGKAINKYFL